MSQADDPEPWEVAPCDAKEALRNGRPGPLATYLDDGATALLRLAALNEEIGSGASGKVALCTLAQPPSTDDTTHPSDDDDWEGTADQILDAIANGHFQLVGTYLTDMADVLRMVSRRLVPASAHRDWQLRFVRRHAGRRPDPNTEQMHARLRLELRFAKAKGIKQESVIADLEERYGVSRSTIMRAMKSSKASAAKSHKSR